MQDSSPGTLSFGSMHIPPRPEVVTALMEEKAKETPNLQRIAKLMREQDEIREQERLERMVAAS